MAKSRNDNRNQTTAFERVFEEELVWIQKRRELMLKCRSESAAKEPEARQADIDIGKQKYDQAYEWANKIQLPASNTAESKDAEIPSDASAHDASTDDDDKDAVNKLDALRDDAFQADLCGLAISGGGVRAATFGLGVLQGLAKEKMLSRFDYLSTVSGGGYIGGFLSAWIREEGIEKVEESLAAGACETTKRSYCEESTEESVEPIRHLRRYSNHLTPVPGVFSYDGWSLLAIFARNLLLNQLTIFLLGLFVFGLIRTAVMVFSFVEPPVLAKLPANVVLLSILAIFTFLCIHQLKKYYSKTGPKKGKEPIESARENWLEQNQDKLLIGLFHCLAITQCLAVTSSFYLQVAAAILLSTTLLLFVICKFFEGKATAISLGGDLPRSYSALYSTVSTRGNRWHLRGIRCCLFQRDLGNRYIWNSNRDAFQRAWRLVHGWLARRHF